MNKQSVFRICTFTVGLLAITASGLLQKTTHSLCFEANCVSLALFGFGVPPMMKGLFAKNADFGSHRWDALRLGVVYIAYFIGIGVPLLLLGLNPSVILFLLTGVNCVTGFVKARAQNPTQ
jgi:hypothetical protein